MVPIDIVARNWRSGEPCHLDDLLRLRESEELTLDEAGMLEHELVVMRAHGILMNPQLQYFVVEAHNPADDKWDAFIVPAFSGGEACDVIREQAGPGWEVAVRDGSSAPHKEGRPDHLPEVRERGASMSRRELNRLLGILKGLPPTDEVVGAMRSVLRQLKLLSQSELGYLEGTSGE